MTIQAPKDPRYVRIAVQGTALAANFLLDDAPNPTAGYDGWQEQARGRRRAILVFAGPSAWTQDIPVSLDAFGENRDKALPILRRQWQILRALSSLPHPGAPPPLATLAGRLLDRTSKDYTTDDWALRNMTPSQPPLHDNETGELVQWVGTLTFTQRIEADIVRITRGPNAGARVYVVKKGDTLASIARANKVKAADITYATGAKIRDGSRVKVNDKLRIPARDRG
jgi:LysM repeat protein